MSRIYTQLYGLKYSYLILIIYTLLYGLSFFSSHFVRVHVVHPWTLTKRLEKKLDGNSQECCEQSWTSPGGNTPQDTNCTATCLLSRKLFKLGRTRHAGHCWRSRDELISDVLLWTPIHGRAKAGRPARTCIQQLCEDTGCSPEDLPEAMNDSEKCHERVRNIRAISTTWWWWWYGLK